MRSQRDELMNIYNVMMKATDEGTVPDGYYGPTLFAGRRQRRCGASILKSVPWCISMRRATSIAISRKQKPSP